MVHLLLQHQLPEGVLGIIVNSDFGNTSAVVLAVQSKDGPIKNGELCQIDSGRNKEDPALQDQLFGILKSRSGCMLITTNWHYTAKRASVMQAIKYQGSIGVLGKVKGNTMTGRSM